MKIRVPVVYEATVTPKKARNPREERFGEWIEVQIREISDMEAPVALRWQDEKYQSAGVDGVCERRWHEGQLWKPAVHGYSGKPNEHLTLDRLAEWTAAGYSYGNPLVSGVDWRMKDFAVKGVDEPLRPEDFRHVMTSGREKAVADAIERGETTISVDGKIWTRTHEPVYRVVRGGGFHSDYVKVDIVSPPEDGANGEGHFRADRFDDLAAYVQDRMGLEADEDRRIHVLIPECLRFEDELPALLSSLQAAVKGQEDRVGQQGRASIIAWVDFREAVAAMAQAADDETIGAAVTAAEVWLTVTDAYDFQKKSLSDALERWNARPIAVDDGHDFRS